MFCINGIIPVFLRAQLQPYSFIRLLSELRLNLIGLSLPPFRTLLRTTLAYLLRGVFYKCSITIAVMYTLLLPTPMA